MSQSLEIGLMAAICQHREYASDVFNFLVPDDFEMPAIRKLAEMAQEGRFFGFASLVDFLKEQDISMSEWTELALSPSEIYGATAVIYENASLRRARIACQQLTIDLAPDEADFDKSIQKFYQNTSERSGRGIAMPTLADLILKYANDNDEGRLYTGDRFLDTIYYLKGGSRRKQVEYVQAITGHGKTQYLGMLASGYAKAGYNAVWFQFEDSARSTVENLTQHIPNGDLAINRIRIIDNAKSIQDVEMVVRRLKSKQLVDVVVLDYIQRVPCIGVRDEREKVTRVSERFTDMAKEFDVYCIGASQVSRAKDRKGYDAFPRVQDGKESSQIEQDAFFMTAIFRPDSVEELRSNGMVVDIDKTGLLPKNVVYVRCLKNRGDKLNHNVRVLEHTESFGLRPFDPINKVVKPIEEKEWD